jgi:ABC-type branched-subunit amino acid transport system substrate-binding protein
MRYNIHTAVIVSLIFIRTLEGFSSIKEMETFTQIYDEAITPDNQDYINPEYISSYLLRSPSISQKIKSIFSSEGHFHNTISSCKKILKELVQYREISGFNHRHVLKINHKSDDVLIIWGDLQGSFHSCVRALIELEKQGIIDNDLNIIKQNHYFIFNGNIVGETDYGLELIECIGSLMLKNPDKVLCTLGKLEDHMVWTSYGLFSQITALTGARGVKFGFASRAKVTEDLIDLLSRFFATLPLGIYIDYPDTNKEKMIHNLISISCFDPNSTELDIHNFGDFLNQTEDPYTIQESLSIYRVGNIIAATVQSIIRVYITSVTGFLNFDATEGLSLREPLDGSLVWSIFSAPNIFQRKINRFYFDAFARVTLKKNLADNTIELLHRDIRTKDKFAIQEKYLLLSGTNIAKNGSYQSDTETITLGASLDLSKSGGNIGTNFRKGVLAALKDEQKDLAPGQPKIHISFFDDKFSPHQASVNLRDIQLAYKLPIVAFPMTSYVMSSYLDSLKTGSLLALFPIAGSTDLHTPEYPGIIFFRPSHEREIKVLINQEISQTPDGHFCFFYQNDIFGQNALKNAQSEAAKHNKTWVEISHLPNQTNFSQQIQEFNKHKFTAVFFFSLGLAVREFIQQLGAEKLIWYNLYGISMTGGQALEHFLQELGLSVTISNVVPNPDNSQLPIVKAYRASMNLRNEPYSVFSLEGYICGSLIIEAAKHSAGSITKDSLTEFFTHLNRYNFKGLSLSFDTKYRDLSQTIWLDQGNPVWQEYKEESSHE